MARPTNEQQETKKRELTDKMRAYAIWMATPEGLRVPATKKEFAERIGVSEVMIWKYSKDPRIAEAIRFLVLQNIGNPDNIQNILQMVYDEAMLKKNVSYAEVWMKATGVMTQFGKGGSNILDVTEEIESDSFANYSDEELARLRELAVAQQAEQESVRRAQEKLA